mmetsp:Transcript_8975/g.13422  ORF Transcript_8975/g.13422 Transcript_8975/m.13422 type:complete len:1248 (-) Transcript_8975:173-3916(-)
MGSLKTNSFLFAVLAIFVGFYRAKVPGAFFVRIARNAFLPGVPEPIPTLFPSTDDETLVKDVTVVISAKDFISQVPEQLKYISQMLPHNIKIIYTYPKPMGYETFQNEIEVARGPLSNIEFVELDSFANPFAGWVEAAPLVKTKYTLFMHNDVYPLDKYFASELYQGLEAHPDCIASAPQIYEAETEGMLVAHAINTNLHLRRKPSGVLFFSHEVDIVKGTDRAPGDFKQGKQIDFMEDHAFMMRTDMIETIVDPNAAFTMEYMDLQMSMRLHNATVWYVPSARVEFRVWGTKFRWQDVAFFGYRRSERLARGTKVYLENKWGIEFPNTGFCNFVKFSVPRTALLTSGRGELPSKWEHQATMVAGWFEWIGFNKFKTGVSDFVMLPDLMNRTRELIKGEGNVLAGRDLIIDEPMEPQSEEPEIAKILPLREQTVNIETRLPFEHLSLGTVKLDFQSSCSAPAVSKLSSTCGLLIESANQDSCTCWVYIAPYNNDNLLLTLISKLLWVIKLPQRVTVYGAMSLFMSDLDTRRQEIEEFNRIPGVSVQLCSEMQESCEVEFSFGEKDRLVQWSGALPSWSTVRSVLASLPGGASVARSSSKTLSDFGLVIILSLIVIHLPIFEARQYFWTVVLLGTYIILEHLNIQAPITATVVLLIVFLFNAPNMSRRSTISTVAGLALYMIGGFSDDVMGLLAVCCALLALRRVYVMVFTLVQTNTLSTIIRVVSHLVPSYSFSRYMFFRADGCSEEIAKKREKAYDKLFKRWQQRYPKSLDKAQDFRKGFSDLRFAASNRVFLPFRDHLKDWCDPTTVVTETKRMMLKDVDGNSLIDIAGSYGVNVCGYDLYKRFLREGMEKVGKLGCVLGPLHPLLKDNIDMLRKVANKPDGEVSFHMSGTEAVMCATRMARFNKKRKMVVVFGGAYHGWWDGVQTIAGNERSAADVITLKDLDPNSLDVIRMRRSEIAAVLINPLQAFHPNSPPPSDLVLASNSRKAGSKKEEVKAGDLQTIEKTYKDWLKKLRKVCTNNNIALIFDEVYTGFRLAPGGAQEYYGIKADLVCYGKTLGGGMPNGVVVGDRKLMTRCDPRKPLRVAYVIGTFSAHPLVLACMHSFLKWNEKEGQAAHERIRKLVREFCIDVNSEMEESKLPLRITAYTSVWTMLFEKPGRYHWLLQYYLKDEGINLSWVGTGRLNFSLDFTKEDMKIVKKKLKRACERMIEDGWWHNETVASGLAIKLKLAKEFTWAFLTSPFST